MTLLDANLKLKVGHNAAGDADMVVVSATMIHKMLKQ